MGLRYVRFWLFWSLIFSVVWLLPTSQANAKRCAENLRKAYCHSLHCEATASSSHGRACQVLNDIYRAQAGFSIFCDDRTLRLVGPFGESEAAVQNQELARFTESTGIPVRVEGGNIEADLEKLLACGADGVFVPQTGMIAELASQGRLVDLSKFADMNQVNEDFSETLRKIVTINGGLYGVWTSLQTKSLIWYPVEAFAKAGYQVPQTWDELIALSDEIVADGGTPWCMYFESAESTGWLLTDWIEDIVLRLPGAGPGVYDDWVSHKVLFSDPPIKDAFARLGEILFTPDYVFDPENIATIPFFCAFVPMFGLQSDLFGDACLAVPELVNPPGCWLHRQAAFAIDFTAGSDVGYFPFPPFDPNLPSVQMGSGIVAIMTRDTPEGRALFNHFLGRSYGEVIAANGSVLANRNIPSEWYQQPGSALYAEQIRNALVDDGFRLDASDLMPFEVGGGSFWHYITQFALGASIDEATAAIDASWPAAQL